MMIKEVDLSKLYYSIGEVAEMFSVNTSLIRFWEKEFSSINPKKNKKGNRLFSPKDILEIQKIYHLVKKEGYTLDGAKKALKENVVPKSVSQTETENETETATFDKKELINRLQSIQKRLLALK